MPRAQTVARRVGSSPSRAALAAGTPGPGGGVARGGREARGDRRARDSADGEPGLVFRLSEGAEGGEAPALVARPPGGAARRRRRAPRARPPAAARRRAARGAVRAPRGLAAPAAHGAHRARVLPARGSGAPRPDAAPAGPLEVLRRMPEGDVPLAPHLSITFSQPMVALDSHAGARARGGPRAAVPAAARRVALGRHADARLRARGPLPHGDRLPRRGPGRHAQRDRRDAGERRRPGRSRRPPPRLVARHPEGGPARRDALMFAAFDQRIDPAAVARLAARARGRRARSPVRLASAAEVEADEAVARLAKAAEPGRFVAFRAERELPADAAVTVTVGAGTPSAEGPRRTAAAAGVGLPHLRALPRAPPRVRLGRALHALRPLAGRAHEPRRREERCARTSCASSRSCRGSRWRPGATPSPSAACRAAARPTASRSRARIADAFGQALEPGGAARVRGRPGARRALRPGRRLRRPRSRRGAALPGPLGQPRRAARRGVRGGPGGLAGLARVPAERLAQRGGRRRPGRRVIDTTVRVAGEPDALTETRLDLGAGARRTASARSSSSCARASTTKETRNAGVRAWVQATRIGLDAFADSETLVAWASDLADGRPLGRRRRSRLGSGRRAHRTPPASPASPSATRRRRSSWRVAGRTSRSSRPRPAGGARARAGGGRARTDSLRFSSSTTGRCTGPARRCASRAGCGASGPGPAATSRRSPPRSSAARVDAARLAGQRGRQGRGPRERPRRLRPRAEAARRR